ncbi:MAG: S8 family serine peptidase [Lachnospiraceae bacterium]|nr:S8 family serine peptidase [Lachnospiraceae bacterium]
MNSQKIENLLNLALDSTEEEREKSMNLDVGYDPQNREWELIVKYSEGISEDSDLLANLVKLSYGYGIIRIPASRIPELAAHPAIEYIEKPKRLFFAVNRGKAASCFSAVQTPEVDLKGQGIIVAVIDSGVDYFHPDFRKEDGSTRILAIWDQTSAAGTPPKGFLRGSEFSQEQINQALSLGRREEGYSIVPSIDYSGHGTEVLGIAAGNGNASGGQYAGGAPQSDILVVKLGTPGENAFPSTTELMQALEYVIQKAREYQKPVAVNLSFGNVYGSHTGTSLLETYINEMADQWKNVISVGTGNEGGGRGHASGRLIPDQTTLLEFAVAEAETVLNLQLWKNYADEMEIILYHPNGESITLGGGQERTGEGAAGAYRYRMGRTELLVYYGMPAPYRVNQEIYIDFIPAEDFVDSGVWKIELLPKRITSGNYDLWLPPEQVLNFGTGFRRPSPDTTLTIPSTAEKVISVGAYDSNRMAFASFSGRGYTSYPEKIKPTLVAPGVNITTTAPGGGYVSVTGTSFAAPFVTAAAALLMQWGIVNGADPYLYGEKVKAYLQRGARKLPGFEQWPNPQAGWGALCVRDSLPV